MREFYVYLVKCQGCLTDEEYVHELNTSSLLQALCSKLPERLQRQWATQVYIIKSTKLRRANFRDFVEFIGKESEVAGDPTFSKEAMSKFVLKRSFNSSRSQRDVGKSRITSLVTKPEVTDTAIGTKSNTVGQANNSTMNAKDNDLECPFCKDKHCLDNCQTFMNRSPFARKMFVIAHKLCFGCYSPLHNVTKCTQKLVCREKGCGMSHPTGMHGTHKFKGKAKASTNDSSQINNGCTKCDDANEVSAEVLSLSVLPMLLWHKSNPNHVIKVYGMLDNCSQGTFIKKDVLTSLDVPKVNTKIIIKTITGIIKEDADIVNDLMVSSLDGSNQIDLPKVFSRQDLLIDRNEIPTPERVRNWSYLEEIADEIPNLDCDIPIGLLIGVNCPAALRPTEVIKERNGGPFAQRTAFGWCIVGPLLNGQSTDKSVNCNRIAVADVTTNKCSHHYFAVQDEVKDINAATVLIDMYRKEFNEPTPKEMKNQLLKGICPPQSTTEKLLTRSSLQHNKQSISIEDEKFLAKIEREVILVNGHYQLPLPFRKDNVKMPNNREQAEQRARWIKKKFASKQFKEDYVTFMNDIIGKGYARKVPESNIKIKEGKTWYLPHHGVYHPNKPGKIRVVFDCSCNYKGTSLNEELLQGPNLTNSLVGVLARFRLEPVAIMADIEAMFYQVHVPENQRSFLRFLWWPNGNTDECLVEYEMCVHIFGAISSPACANFALHKTAEDNMEKFGYEALQCVKKDFYVDDLLKSKDSVESTIDIISKIKMMCASGGFNLTKFTSNERAVIQSIPDEDLSKNIKNLNLELDTLPVERALGMTWNIENDTLNFRITLKDLPLTRRGILATVSSIYDPLGLVSPLLLLGRRILQEIVADNKSWDEGISEQQRFTWEKWRKDLNVLDKIQTKRSFKPLHFGKIVSAQIHHFSGASEVGYGEASYLRLLDEHGQISSTLIMAKLRVAPLKPFTTPRLELTAATVAVKVGYMLYKELQIDDLLEYYWTDSKLVLQYLNNEKEDFMFLLQIESR